MKVAVISDIHANWPALEAAVDHVDRWQPDLVVVNGDIINRGPSNRRCWEFVQSRVKSDGWQVVRGNHEDYVLFCGNPSAPQQGPEAELRQFTDWTYAQIQDYAYDIVSLPDRFACKAPDGSQFFVTHGTMRGNRIGIYPKSTDEEIEALISPAPAVFVTAHTHRPLQRHVGSTLISNVGSVGLPFDGDWRPSYGQFTWQATAGWQGQIVRFEYDRDQAIRDLSTSRFLTETGPFGHLVLVEYRTALGMIHRWSKIYQKPVLDGEITVADAVKEFLEYDEFRAHATLPTC